LYCELKGTKCLSNYCHKCATIAAKRQKISMDDNVESYINEKNKIPQFCGKGLSSFKGLKSEIYCCVDVILESIYQAFCEDLYCLSVIQKGTMDKARDLFFKTLSEHSIALSCQLDTTNPSSVIETLKMDRCCNTSFY